MGWAAGGALSTAKEQLAGCGIDTAALSIAGYDGTYVESIVCESYDGAAWGAEADYFDGMRLLAACGTLGAGLAFGGNDGATDVHDTREYDGAAWAAGGDLSGVKASIGGAGTQAAGLCMGGIGDLTATEEYDGAAWAGGGALNTGRDDHGACGLQTDAVCMGGKPGLLYTTSTEEYDGAAWAGGGALGTGRSYNRAFGTGSGDAATCGGWTAAFTYTDTTELYNGAAWSAGPAMTVGTAMHGTAGNTTNGLAFGGEDDLTGAPVTTTLEYTPGAPIVGELDQNLPMLVLQTEGIKYLIADLPALTLSATLDVRSGEILDYLPALTMASTGMIGSKAALEKTLASLKLAAEGKTGQVGSTSVTLPMLTVSASGWPVGVGVLTLDLPAFRILAHGQPAAPTYAVLTMNTKRKAVTEYEAFPFNSFAYFNGEYLGAKSTGIHRLTGENDAGAPIDASATLGKIPLGQVKARDIWFAGRSTGAMQISLSADEGTPNYHTLSYLLSTLNQGRVKVPRGLKPVYLQIGIKNLNGEGFDLDSLQVEGEPIQRKKR